MPNHGTFECIVEVPNEGEKHRTRRAKDVLAEYDELPREFLDAMAIQTFIPLEAGDETTRYKLGATVVYGDSE